MLKKENDRNRNKENQVAYRKRYYQENRIQLIEYQRLHRKTDAGREQMRKADSDLLRKCKKKMRTHLRREMGGSTSIKMKDFISIINMRQICVVCAAEKDLTIDQIS